MPTGLIGDWLSHHALVRPNQLACIDLLTERRYTYAQFAARSQRLARALRDEFRIGAGDRVLVLAHNSTDQFEILFAAWRLGAVFAPVNWRLAAPELRAVIEDADPSLIIADEGLARVAHESGRRVLARRPGDATSEYEQAIATAAPLESFAAADLDTLNTLLYTSGTTGRPKGVLGTWRMTTLLLLQSCVGQRLTERSVTLTAAPQFHTAGLNSFTTPLFHIGGAVAVMPRWDAHDFLVHLTTPALGVTHTLAVPTQYQMVTQLAEFATQRFDHVHAAVGGAPATSELLHACAARGLKLRPAYGMTECFGVTVGTDDVVEAGAVGWPAIYTEIRIVGDTGEVLPTHEIGEIQIRSAGVTPGYWRQPEETAAAFVDGWFRTGDLGYRDAAGCLHVVDRRKDMFISGGENVYPVEVENVLATLPEVRQVAVIGVRDETWGEVGAAIVVPRDGAPLDLARVVEHCRGRIAPYKIPRQVHVVSELPLSAQGKVLKSELRRRYG